MWAKHVKNKSVVLICWRLIIAQKVKTVNTLDLAILTNIVIARGGILFKGNYSHQKY